MDGEGRECFRIEKRDAEGFPKPSCSGPAPHIAKGSLGDMRIDCETSFAMLRSMDPILGTWHHKGFLGIGTKTVN